MKALRLRPDTTTDMSAVVYSGDQPVATTYVEERYCGRTGEVHGTLLFKSRDAHVKTAPIVYSDWPPTEEDMERALVILMLHGVQVWNGRN